MAGPTPDFEQFARAALPRLARFADVLTGEHQLAEDVVQEVLIKLHKHWPKVSTLEFPHAYARRMVVNEYISARRRMSRFSSSILLEDVHILVDDDASRLADRDELAARLRTLPPRQRAAIVLRFYADLSDSEISEALGCSPVTVRSHVSRGLANLRVNPPTVASGRWEG